jgi:sirohydrochlorin cobaltochelatase
VLFVAFVVNKDKTFKKQRVKNMLITLEPQPPTALLLIGHGSRDGEGLAEFQQLAALLAEQLALFVQPCFLEFAAPSIVEAIGGCVRAGYRRIIALPLFLGPAGHQKNDVPAAINWARAQWPEVSFQYGTPLGAQYSLVEALAERAEQILQPAQPIPIEQTALALIGRGSSDPESNAEVAKLARLLAEGRGYSWVEYGFYGLSQPDTAATIARCVALGARQVVVLPYLLFSGRISKRIGMFVEAARHRHPAVPILLAAHLGSHRGVLAAIGQRYSEATEGRAAMNCDLCKYRQAMPGFIADYGRPQGSDHSHGLRGTAHGHGMPSALAMLPPRYQGGAAVSAAPMAAAELAFDAAGQVAWDRMWGQDDPNSPFCELALAGGPPHRSELLEPVPPQQIEADPAGYAQVRAELERGIAMTTGLAVEPQRYPGWLGVACASDEMAIWLLRAILVENISVRREGATLFLPAGPAFRLAYEIKNVITALAKTHHYWQEHLRAQMTVDGGR